MAVYDVFTPECLNDLFPIQRTNDFFDALFGDAEEGAYDIRLVVDPEESDDGELHFYFELHQRAGRCLVCSLTYGLPQVFERHPIINLKGLVSDIASRAGWNSTMYGGASALRKASPARCTASRWCLSRIKENSHG